MDDSGSWGSLVAHLDDGEETGIFKGSGYPFLISQLLVDSLFRYMAAFSYPYTDLKSYRKNAFG